MEMLHTTIPADLIRQIFDHVRNSGANDDHTHTHDRGMWLSQMDYVPTLVSHADEMIKQIDSAWINSLKEHNQTNCKEYKEFYEQLQHAEAKGELSKGFELLSPRAIVDNVNKKKRACCMKKS
jgi:hypothetical protein